MIHKSKYILVIATGILLFFGFLVFFQNKNETSDLRLDYTEDNKIEIENFLSFYSKHDDPLKYHAARFIADNMVYHTFINNSIEVDSSLIRLIDLADSMYYNLVKGKSIEEIESAEIKDSIKSISNYIESIDWKIKDSEVSLFERSPYKISAELLHEHIEHSFRLRESLPFVSALSFEDFCEYILPPQANFNIRMRKSNQELYNFIAKYIVLSDTIDATESAKLYGLTRNAFRAILGKYPLSAKVGFEELFFYQVPGWDCYDESNYAMAFLNSVGIPTSSEFNIAYKMLQGNHSKCGIIGDSNRYSPFSLGRRDYYPILSTDQTEATNGYMNIYRIHFSAQKDAPVFLKGKNEEIPRNLSSPLIEDITSIRIKTQSLTLPFTLKTKNKLAYLATFNSRTGTLPVTWGKINKGKRSVTFENVIPNRIYFPVYFDGADLKAFDSPFMFIKDSISGEDKFSKVKYDSHIEDAGANEVIITRKFPKKDQFIQTSKQFIGTVILGSNDPMFKVHDTLYIWDFVPEPYLQDIQLNNVKPYQHYRIKTPNDDPSLNISEVQFLTNKNYNYTNTIPATPLPVLKPTEIGEFKNDFVRLLEDSLKKVSRRAHYDGNMQTQNYTYHITSNLKQRQIVNKIRFAPMNADNGIKVGHQYELLTYDNGQWKRVGTQKPKYNFLGFRGLSKNVLYWLRNRTEGREEVPFIIDKNGEQVFIYN